MILIRVSKGSKSSNEVNRAVLKPKTTRNTSPQEETNATDESNNEYVYSTDDSEDPNVEYVYNKDDSEDCSVEYVYNEHESQESTAGHGNRGNSENVEGNEFGMYFN